MAANEINIGVINKSNAACVGRVSDNPFIKNVWLSEIPHKAHKTNLPQCCFFIRYFLSGEKNNKLQNKNALTPARKRFIAKGCIKLFVVRCLTALIFMAKNKLANSMPICAFCFEVNSKFL